MSDIVGPSVNVGIFWYIAGRVYGEVELLNIKMHAIEGKIDSHFEHWRVWETPEQLVGMPIRRDDYEYFAFPRGRVLYDVVATQHIVYCDRSLLNHDAQKMISDLFGIQIYGTKWCRDAHYTTDKSVIRDLFNDGI